MLKTVVLYENSLDFSEFQVFEVEDHLAFLTSRWEKWPDTGRIYHGDISQVTDVTPFDEASVEKLAELEGTFHCVIYPGEPITILYVVVAVLFVAALVMMPSIPTVSQRNTQNPSPNNELSSRTNRARLNGRIPDIFGQVRSTPDLIAQTYSVFEDHLEVEHTLMCIGRGQYEVHDSYDGETPVNQIAGASVQAYLPYDNPITSVATPFYSVGSPIDDEFYNCVKSNSVNGQVLRPPNYNDFYGFSDITFTYPDVISIPVDTRNFETYFNTGDSITIENAEKYASASVVVFNLKITSANSIRIFTPTIPTGFVVGQFVSLINCDLNVDTGGTILWVYHLSGTYEISAVGTGTESGSPIVNVTFNTPATVNAHWSEYGTYGDSEYGAVTTSANAGALLLTLDGVYTIVSVNPTEIVVSNPSIVNPDWNDLSGSPFVNSSANITANGVNWVGPFILENPTRKGLISNFVALNGLYEENSDAQYPIGAEITLEVTPVNNLNVPTGAAETVTHLLLGSGVIKDSRAITFDMETAFTGRCSVRAARITASPTDFEGSVVDEIKWRDLYTKSHFTNDNFGNVTTLRTKSLATSGALSVKERKLNMLVTRQIPLWEGGTTFSTTLHSTKLAMDIAFHVALDPKIGNRNASEIDFANIQYNAYTYPQGYFGTDNAVEFCYTFDKTNLSFEETIGIVGAAVFCVPYRLGNVIKMSFEGATEDSTLLFNHRNKMPGSETRTVSFGNQNDNDGIELEYVSPEDDAVITLYLPEDQSAVNPKKIETAGVRNSVQAHFHSWRHYNKLRYQNMQVEFDATQEADMSIPTDRILVADNTRSGTQDGQINNAVGLVVYTSQALTFAPGVDYTMFLQLSDGTVQAIAASQGPLAASATLATAPNLPLVTDRNSYAQTTYILVGNDDVRQKAFLVTEKITQDNMTSKVRAANYDARFYEHDTDYINELI